MCNAACLDFGRAHLSARDVAGKRVLEVGARDINGSLRATVLAHGPAEYLGVDVRRGPGVDVLCDVLRLTRRFGRERFDLVLATEILEHVRDWRRAVDEMKGVLATGGILLVTTRSPGFPYHGYPHDFWRYTREDMAAIFADLTLEALEDDPLAPGVFFQARKPASFHARDVAGVRLHCVLTGRRERTVPRGAFASVVVRHTLRALARRALRGRAGGRAAR